MIGIICQNAIAAKQGWPDKKLVLSAVVYGVRKEMGSHESNLLHFYTIGKQIKTDSLGFAGVKARFWGIGGMDIPPIPQNLDASPLIPRDPKNIQHT
ncbi:MAG: hypothetical protein Fur0022_43990 [Anaerolineales bacterium]